jgi:hypothetical protein
MNNQINNAFKKELEEINQAGDVWFTTQYKSATKTLAEIFQTLYVMRGKYFDKVLVSTEAYQSRYELLKSACGTKGCAYRKNAPTVAELLVKLAFFQSGSEKRVSGYLRAFNTLTVLEEVNETNVADFIIAAGGIEEVRLMQEDGTEKVDKAAVATGLVKEMETLSVISDSQHAKANTANAGEIVIMVGVQTAEGTVELKEFVWAQRKDGDKALSGKTAIRTALMNVYSVNNASADGVFRGAQAVKNPAPKKAASPSNSDLIRRAVEDIKGQKDLEFAA